MLVQKNTSQVRRLLQLHLFTRIKIASRSVATRPWSLIGGKVVKPDSIAASARVIAGEIVCVALCDLASGASLDVTTCGVFELAKVDADAAYLLSLIWPINSVRDAF